MKGGGPLLTAELDWMTRWLATETGKALFIAVSVLAGIAIFLVFYQRVFSLIQIAPGSRLRKLAEFSFSRPTYEQILEPVIRDLLDEYCKALADQRPWKARWVRIRGYYSFWSALFSQLPISAVKMVYKIWQATR